MLSGGTSTDFKALVQFGAQVIDVRTTEEFAGGHIKGSKNIPLHVLPTKLSQLNPDKPVITCCAAGGRSASAAQLLKEKGFKEVYNGGGWYSLNQKLH